MKHYLQQSNDKLRKTLLPNNNNQSNNLKEDFFHDDQDSTTNISSLKNANDAISAPVKTNFYENSLLFLCMYSLFFFNFYFCQKLDSETGDVVEELTTIDDEQSHVKELNSKTSTIPQVKNDSSQINKKVILLMYLKEIM